MEHSIIYVKLNKLSLTPRTFSVTPRFVRYQPDTKEENEGNGRKNFFDKKQWKEISIVPPAPHKEIRIVMLQTLNKYPVTLLPLHHERGRVRPASATLNTPTRSRMPHYLFKKIPKGWSRAVLLISVH